jgi:acetyltransferase
MVQGGTEVIVGVSRDPTFGPVILFGIGGVNVELYQDVAMRVCPISRADAEEMVGALKGAKLLHGYRGRPASDVEALVDVLLRVSDLAVALEPELAQLDINPLAVLPRGQGVKALDALMVLG